MSKPAKSDIWMPLYVSDWDDKTSHLDCEQDGAYGRLVRNYWKNGPPIDDDAVLARIVRMDRARWRKVRSAVAPFFVIRDGRWFHERVEEELERARAIIEKRRDAGSKGGRPRKQKVSEQKPNGSVLLSENTPKNGVFEKQTETPARVAVDRWEVVPLPSQSGDVTSSEAEVISLAGRAAR